MTAQRIIKFGIIGCGLMGREFASAAARWIHLREIGVRPQIVAVCDANPDAMTGSARRCQACGPSADYHDLLADSEVEAVYCAVPHNLHAAVLRGYFARGQASARREAVRHRPRGISASSPPRSSDAPICSCAAPRNIPSSPARRRSLSWAQEGRFGRDLRGRERLLALQRPQPHEADQLEAPHRDQRRIRLHRRPRHARASTCRCASAGAPRNVRALLTKIVTERPGPDGQMVPCETWDNAILACEVTDGEQHVPNDASRRSASRRDIRARMFIARPGHRVLGGVHDEVSQTAALPAVHARRRAGLARGGYAVLLRPTRRSPATSSSSASPTPSCRCGPPSATSWPTGATACSSHSTARRRGDRGLARPLHGGAGVAAQRADCDALNPDAGKGAHDDQRRHHRGRALLPGHHSLISSTADGELHPGKLVDVGPAVLAPGGTVSNVGLSLSRLGARVRMVGKVGDDHFGRILLALYRERDPALANGHDRHTRRGNLL